MFDVEVHCIITIQLYFYRTKQPHIRGLLGFWEYLSLEFCQAFKSCWGLPWLFSFHPVTQTYLSTCSREHPCKIAGKFDFPKETCYSIADWLQRGSWTGMQISKVKEFTAATAEIAEKPQNSGASAFSADSAVSWDDCLRLCQTKEKDHE